MTSHRRRPERRSNIATSERGHLAISSVDRCTHRRQHNRSCAVPYRYGAPDDFLSLVLFFSDRLALLSGAVAAPTCWRWPAARS